MAEIAVAIYWINPLIWYAAAQMRREQEHAADDDVLKNGVCATDYAAHLIAIARSNGTPLLAAGAAHRSDLTIRIQAILDPGRVRTMVTRKLVLSGIVALFTIALPLASMQADRKVHKMEESGVIKPRLVEKHEPAYTQAARDAKIEGTVRLSAVIEADGKIHEAEVEKSLDEGLDANAIAAVRSWRFEAAQKDGEPVAVACKIEVNFRLL